MQQLLDRIAARSLGRCEGEVLQVSSQTLRARGPDVELGAMCNVLRDRGDPLLAEVIALAADSVVLMPYGTPSGIRAGARIVVAASMDRLGLSPAMLGRVVGAFGEPLDGKGPIEARSRVPLGGTPVHPVRRRRIEQPLETGVRVIDAMLPMGRGQRVGVFAGSGVGKSTLMGMLTQNVEADVCVVALIGERGREVREFIESRLGAKGLARSVVVVATADQPAVYRARAAHAATAMAEYFRDQGRSVLLLMDSVTRFAMARREIDLAAGEPPTARGYTPSVFSALPALCERAGTGENGGSISAIYTVLVEGDDPHEPVADTLRATLDGHVWLSREQAQRGVFPAVDILHSVSRLASDIASKEELATMSRVRDAYAGATRNREVLEMGLYKAGANPELDRQVALMRAAEQVFRQDAGEHTPRAEALRRLQQAVEAVR